MTILEQLYDPAIEHFAGLRLLVNLTMDSFGTGDVQPVDDLLRDADFGRLEPVFSSGMLRYTYSKQTFLPHWKSARDRVVEDFKNRGLDWQDELRGLFGEYSNSFYGASLIDDLTHVHPSLRT